MESMDCICGAKKTKYTKWHFIILLFIVIIIIGVIFYVRRYKKDDISSIDTVSQQNDNIINTPESIETDNTEDEENGGYTIVTETMPETLQGYTIVGKIQIEKINVDKYILGMTDNKSLNASVTKLWGGKINTPGNFSIIGHNRTDQFIGLKKLEIGDTFSLIGRDKKKFTYQIYDIKTVKPNDVSCIESKNDGTTEATLITCTPGGQKRLVLKGKKI